MLHIGRVAITFNDCKEDEQAFRIFDSVIMFCKLNKIPPKNILSIIFSQTKDIDKKNPAQLLRIYDLFNMTALFCSSEPEYSSAISNTVRMLVFFNKFTIGRYYPKAVYKYGAEILRPDLLESSKH